MKHLLVVGLSMVLSFLSEPAFGSGNPHHSLSVVPADNVPPGGLAPAQTPQIVLLTFDDSITTDSFAIVQQILTNHWNPNGDAIKATFFVSLDSCVDYPAVQRLYAAGNEIGIHTMSQTTSIETDLATWRAEIVSCRKTLSALGAIPESAIAGFRAPYLQFNNESFRILAERGFRYDASVIEYPGNSPYSTNGANYLWPYTLDDGVVQDCFTGIQPTQNFAGLFEVPIWDHLDKNGVPVVAMDPPESYNYSKTWRLWTNNFTMRYTGNRCPVTICLHAAGENQWMGNTSQPWRVDVLNDFITWAHTHPDVWFLTERDLVDFMQNPCDVTVAPTSTIFRTITNSVYPPELINTCYYVTNCTIFACGTCPVAYPGLSTVYTEVAPVGGGFMEILVSTNEADNTEIRIAVSNDLPVDALDWSVVLYFPTNYALPYLIEGNYTVITNNGSMQITVHAADYLRPLLAGELQTNAYLIVEGTDIVFDVVSFTLYDVVPMRPAIDTVMFQPDGQLMMTWNESAMGYRVQSASNLPTTNWSDVIDVYGDTTWTGTVAAPSPVFLRVRGIE